MCRAWTALILCLGVKKELFISWAENSKGRLILHFSIGWLTDFQEPNSVWEESSFSCNKSQHGWLCMKEGSGRRDARGKSCGFEEQIRGWSFIFHTACAWNRFCGKVRDLSAQKHGGDVDVWYLTLCRGRLWLLLRTLYINCESG